MPRKSRSQHQMQYTSFPLVFQGVRGWNPAVSGLAFLPMALGSMIGIAFAIIVINPKYAAKHARLHYLPPEERLMACIIGGTLMP